MRRRIEQGLPIQAITLFTPIGMAEDLTKVQLNLCNEIKTEIQEVKNLLTAFPHEEMQRNFSEIATLLDERMSNLEEQYSELKKIVKQGSIQNYIANPALLEHWNPSDMVIRHSPWTTMRLVLNKFGSSEDDNGEDSTIEDITDDDVFFSAEAEEELLGPIADDQEATPESERNLEKKNSSTDVSEGYKEIAKPQMSNLPCDSSLHSRDETTTPTHQTDHKMKKKNKKKKNKDRSDETDEIPMILDEEDQTPGREIPKKRKGFSYYPLLTYK